MTGFFRAFKGEMRKLNRRRKYTVLLIIFLIIYLIGRAIMSFTDVSGARSIVMGNSLLTVYLPLIAFIATNDLISSEIHDKSIQQCLIKPVTRMQVYFAKCLAALVKCVRHAFLLIAIDYILCYIGLNAGSYLQAAYMLFDLIPLMTLIAFSALISVLISNAALSMLLTLVTYAGLHVAGSFLGLSTVLFTSYLNWHGMLHGGLSVIGFAERILAVMAPGVLFAVLGAIVLERKRF